MKRKLLALAVLAALATPVCADYLVIRINLSPEAQQSSGDKTAGNDANRPNTGGFGLGTGAGGAPAGAGGGGGGMGKFGRMGAPGGGGGAAGPAGAGGGPGRGGNGGMPPLGLGSGGGGGGGPGRGGSGAMPPLGTGSGGGGGGRQGGRPGGLPGVGAGGGGPGGSDDAVSTGGGGAGGFRGGAPQGNTGESGDLTPSKEDLFIVATEVTVSRARTSNKVSLTTKWGTTVLDPETSLPGRATMQIIKTSSLSDRLSQARRDYVDGQTNKDYMKLAEWMLQNWNLPSEGKTSMHEKFDAYLTELTPIAPTLNPTDRAKYEALMKVKAQLSQAVASPKEEIELIKALQSRIGKDYRSLSKGHYLIYYSPQDEKLAEAKITKLEQAIAGVLYWCALETHGLPVPTKQMVCVLADTADKFKSLHTMFDSIPLQCDGFYAPQDNITVLAPQRIDPSFERFSTLANNVESTLRTHNNLDFKSMMRENPNKPYINTTTSKNEDYVSAVVTGQVFALAKNAALEEGETTTATHQAFVQLAGAAGLLPRAVQLPRSIREGLSNFFATPKSSGELNLPTLWTGIGGPHWLYVPLFRKLIDANKSSSDKGEITVEEKTANAHRVKVGPLDLIQVITDRNFDAAEKAEAKDRDFLREKAKAEAWSVTYFLLYKKSDLYRKFFDEIREMPRDLDLSAEVLEQAFGRAFDLLDAKGEKLDTAKVGRLQNEWLAHMGLVVLPISNADKK
jgi:hypothetical protein